jgi:hypothetical protein
MPLSIIEFSNYRIAINAVLEKSGCFDAKGQIGCMFLMKWVCIFNPWSIGNPNG